MANIQREMVFSLIEHAKDLNPHYPGWYHYVNYLVQFGAGHYEEALAEAQRIHVEGLLRA